MGIELATLATIASITSAGVGVYTALTDKPKTGETVTAQTSDTTTETAVRNASDTQRKLAAQRAAAASSIKTSTTGINTTPTSQRSILGG